MKNISTIILFFIFVPVLIACFLFISIMITHFEPNIIALKLGQDTMLNQVPQEGILSLILPAYYVFTLLGFMIIGIFVYEINKRFHLGFPMEDFQSLFFVWCPMGVVLAVLFNRIYAIQHLSFVNKYDLFGLLVILVLHSMSVLAIRNEVLFYKIMAVLNAFKKRD